MTPPSGSAGVADLPDVDALLSSLGTEIQVFRRTKGDSVEINQFVFTSNYAVGEWGNNSATPRRDTLELLVGVNWSGKIYPATRDIAAEFTGFIDDREYSLMPHSMQKYVTRLSVHCVAEHDVRPVLAKHLFQQGYTGYYDLDAGEHETVERGELAQFIEEID